MVPTIRPGRVCSAECARVTAALSVTSHENGQAEIRETQRGGSFRNQDVLGLDVPMDDAGGVRGGQAVGHTGQQLDDLPPRAFRLGPVPGVPPSANSVTRNPGLDLPTS